MIHESRIMNYGFCDHLSVQRPPHHHELSATVRQDGKLANSLSLLLLLLPLLLLALLLALLLVLLLLLLLLLLILLPLPLRRLFIPIFLI
jgi:hypothetical protein